MLDIILLHICYFFIEYKFNILLKKIIFSVEILVSVHFDLVQQKFELGQTMDDLMLNRIYQRKASVRENIGRASLTKGDFFVDLCFKLETCQNCFPVPHLTTIRAIP